MRIHLAYRFYAFVRLKLLKEFQQAERLVRKMDKKDDCVKGTIKEMKNITVRNSILLTQ